MLYRILCVVMVLCFSFLSPALAGMPTKSYTPPPVQEPIGTPCLVKDGFTICDPQLIELILRYDLDAPGITPIEFNTVEELRSFLEALFTGLHAEYSAISPDPVIGPFDPGTSRLDPGQDIDTGRPPSFPPAGSDGVGSGCSACSSSLSSPPLQPRSSVVEVCQEIYNIWIAKFVGSTCVEVWVEYYPGQKYIQVQILRAYHDGFELDLVIFACDVQVEGSCWLANDARELWVDVTAYIVWYVGLKVEDVHLGLRIKDVRRHTEVLVVPSE
jgi:hypothetical protein